MSEEMNYIDELDIDTDIDDFDIDGEKSLVKQLQAEPEIFKRKLEEQDSEI